MTNRIELTKDDEKVLEYTLETILMNLKKAGRYGSICDCSMPFTDFDVVTLANLLLEIRNNKQ